MEIMILFVMLIFVAAFVWKMYSIRFQKYNLTFRQWSDLIAKDKTVWSIVAVNLIVAAVTIIGGRNFANLLWIYWYQTIIVGIFMCIKIIDRKSDDGIVANLIYKIGSMVSVLSSLMVVFMIGGFLCFASAGTNSLMVDDLKSIIITAFTVNIIAIAMLFLNHLFSFVYNRKKDRVSKNKIGIMLFSYRIVPVFMGIFVLSALKFRASVVAIIVFVLMKICLDIIGHVDEHIDASIASADKPTLLTS